MRDATAAATPHARLERVDDERRAVRYEFLIREQLSPLVRETFPDLEVAVGPVGGTVLFGHVGDNAALQGILSRLSNLGIQVIEMRRLPD